MTSAIIPFDQTSYLRKIIRLRALAKDVAKKFPIKVKALIFIRHNANAIFRVTDTQDKNTVYEYTRLIATPKMPFSKNLNGLILF